MDMANQSPPPLVTLPQRLGQHGIREPPSSFYFTVIDFFSFSIFRRELFPARHPWSSFRPEELLPAIDVHLSTGPDIGVDMSPAATAKISKWNLVGKSFRGLGRGHAFDELSPGDEHPSGQSKLQLIE